MATPPRKNRPARSRKNQETVEAEIARLNDDGIGIGRHEGKEIWVAGAFPGEKVAATIEAEGQRRRIGQLRKVLQKHPQRIVSPCGCSNSCQGCPMITLSPEGQLQFKQTRIRSALSRYPSLRGIEIAPVLAAKHPFGYRTNAKLVMGRKRGEIRIGLYRRGTHDVVDVGDCPLHHPLINKIVAVVRDEVAKQEIFVYDPVKQRGLLRYLTVKVSPELNKAMVTFVTAERDFRRLTRLAKALSKKIPEVISVQQNVNSSSGNVVFGRETLKMLGVPDLLDQVGETRLRIAPTSFFQVNHEQAARIYALVRQWADLSRDDFALDLYCGIGGIALNLARDAGEVFGIEVVEEAVRNARENARLNGLRNCRFNAGDAREILDDLQGDLPPGAVITLNPPRGGCDPELLEAVASLAPRRVIYVSCDPDTLARDLDILAQNGLQTVEAQPVDMFPQTSHVETVVRIEP
ncbi:MAG: 23S rRNA (uracil(1939)-C(5))-methyltransferase RlmD, partial [Desulfuromonas sp.]